MTPRKPRRRAASPTGGVPMESLVRLGEASDLIGHARELYNATITGFSAPMTQADEVQAAHDALRQALVFSITARRFLDGNVVG